ncbi:16S rRNA (uracil(1498)-N(3))-methyltransferase [Oceanobacillus chungangensis]|uniref:Ribosomal RNA small subunit methyltransferase E n=1 Tax=Oceanobacillus chungangensis TaxID=1229152 RepID=A0A3D8Q2N2_9BACI|nr:16S rRNA (uracil(1498)-N(3))-methyltransferase [Oceanobacillus chungangensis]RDW21759.1 16S rRNA (uracil(1498)-N(3))-methyltransferase [Oceanobacillus chungangensis]
MQRYFIPQTDWEGNEVNIKGDDAHHIIRVMRSQVGDQIICNHQDGNAAVCKITSLNQDSVHATVIEWKKETVELPIAVTIAQGLPKGDKFDLVLQKGTELGANAFIPLKMDRSIVVWDGKKIEKKMARFKKIVKEASEQSHRNKIPEIALPLTVTELINESVNYDVKMFAYEEEAKVVGHQSFADIVSQMVANQSVLVCIGPEGGFSEQEARVLRENGFYSVRLGPRILRTETASLYALASLSYHFEELNGGNE